MSMVIHESRVCGREFPAGVPDGVDRDSRLYTLPSAVELCGREWSDLLATVDYVRLDAGDFKRVTRLYLADGWTHRGPEVANNDRLGVHVAQQRQLVTSWVRDTFGEDVRIEAWR